MTEVTYDLLKPGKSTCDQKLIQLMSASEHAHKACIMFTLVSDQISAKSHSNLCFSLISKV